MEKDHVEAILVSLSDKYLSIVTLIRHIMGLHDDISSPSDVDVILLGHESVITNSGIRALGSLITMNP